MIPSYFLIADRTFFSPNPCKPLSAASPLTRFPADEFGADGMGLEERIKIVCDTYVSSNRIHLFSGAICPHASIALSRMFPRIMTLSWSFNFNPDGIVILLLHQLCEMLFRQIKLLPEKNHFTILCQCITKLVIYNCRHDIHKNKCTKQRNFQCKSSFAAKLC